MTSSLVPYTVPDPSRQVSSWPTTLLGSSTTRHNGHGNRHHQQPMTKNYERKCPQAGRRSDLATAPENLAYEEKSRVTTRGMETGGEQAPRSPNSRAAAGPRAQARGLQLQFYSPTRPTSDVTGA